MRKQLLVGLTISATLLLMTLLASVSSSRPQLQQSGGAGTQTSIVQGGNTATVSAGGGLSENLTQVGGNTVLTGNGVTGNGSPRVTIASDQTAFAVNSAQSGTWTIQPGNTANTTAWLVKTIPDNGCGTTRYDSGATVVPSSATVLTSTTTCVDRAVFNNTTSSAVTITFQDNQGTPKDYLTTFSLPGNSQVILPFGYAKFLSGIKWSAGTASAVNGQVVGYQ